MPRTRWAVRCHATRSTDGKPCTRWAIRGGLVCPAHGGASPNARQAARHRLQLDDFARAAERQVANRRARVATWQVGRVLAVAAVTGDDPAALIRNPAWLAAAEVLYGVRVAPAPGHRDDRRLRVHRAGYGQADPIAGVRMRPAARGQHLPGCAGWPTPRARRMCPAETGPALAARWV